MTPTRMCVGCRGREPQNQLIRVVCQGNRIAIDPQQTAAGRGAWLHPSRECFSTAIARKAVARALRVPVWADISSLTDFATEKLT